MTRDEVLSRRLVYAFDWGEPNVGECEVLGRDMHSDKVVVRRGDSLFTVKPEWCFTQLVIARRKCRESILSMIDCSESRLNEYREKLAEFDGEAGDPEVVNLESPSELAPA